MRKSRIVISIIVLLLIAFRLALPAILRSQINQKLQNFPGYKGHVGDVHLALWRGAFALNDLSLARNDGDMSVRIEKLEVGLDWSALLHRSLVCEVRVEEPAVDVVITKPSKAPEKVKDTGKAANEAVKQQTGKDIPTTLSELIPFRVNRFELKQGRVALHESKLRPGRAEDNAPHAQPIVTDLHIVATNLTNSKKISKSLVSEGRVTAKLAGSGKVEITLQIDPVAAHPTFHSTVVIQKFELKSIDQLLEWQTGLQFKEGTFELYSEAAAQDGGFKGYVRPFIENLKVQTPAGENKFILKVKKVVVNTSSKIFSNKDTKNVATNIPFQGRFDKPDAGIWQAVLALLRNAFIEAIKPSLDPGIKIRQ